MKRRCWFQSGLLLVCVLQIPCSAAPKTAAAEWQTVACVPADLPPEAMFEVTQPVDDFEAAALAWQALEGGQNAKCLLGRDAEMRHGGQAALRVDYDFVGKPEYEYIQITTPLDVPTAGCAFGFWLNHGGTSFPTRLRMVDASGETHQVELFSGGQPGWQFVAGSLDGPSTSWGGDGNRRRDYPCRLVGICLDRPERGYVGKGSLWVDEVALLRPRDPSRTLRVETPDGRFGNLYAVGESVLLRASGQGDHVRWSLDDFWGRTLARGEGPAAGVEARFLLEQPGYFACRLELLRGAEPVEIQLFCCAALPDGEEAARSDFVGVSSHYGQNNYPLPSMDLMRRYGIDQFRDEIAWRSYETEKGRRVMPAHAAAYLKHAAELKMRPLIIFDYNNPHYDDDGFPNSPEAIAAFAAYAVDLARQTRGTVGTFEVWNEWIGGCGMGGRPGDHGPEAYGRLLKATYAAVKQAFPDRTVVGIGGEYGRDCAENIVRALGTAGSDSMDAWSIHPYRYPRSPERSDLVGEVQRIADRVEKAGAHQPVWVTEIGWPTHRTSGGSDERVQARYCVRSLALLQSTGAVEKVFWYDFKDDGTRRDYNEHNFGLVRHQTYRCAPKPGVVAMSVFIRMTSRADFRELRRDGSAYTAWYRRPDGRDVVVAWTEAGSQRVSWVGKLETAVDIMGAAHAVSDSIELTENPVYLVGSGLRLGVR
ncbi:MAG TPA: glycosyl hydrolase [Thermoguttaceae bacterium]|nr:glycosyl hydrolase [Thermoguttaceae bacterium]